MTEQKLQEFEKIRKETGNKLRFWMTHIEASMKIESLMAYRRWIRQTKPSAVSTKLSAPVPLDIDEDLLFVQIEDDEEVYAVTEKNRTVVEAHLTPEEKVVFEEAKVKQLMSFLQNNGMRAVKEADVPEGESAPLRFLCAFRAGKQKHA